MAASLHSSFLKVPKSQRTSKIFHVFQTRVKHSAAFSQMTTGCRLQSLSVQSLWSSPGFRQTAAALLWLSLGAPVTPVKWAIKGNFLTRSARALKKQWAQSLWLALEAHWLFLSFPFCLLCSSFHDLLGVHTSAEQKPLLLSFPSTELPLFKTKIPGTKFPWFYLRFSLLHC